MKPILQSSLPISPWADAQLSRLPGVQPLGKGDWLIVDDAFAGQMGERDRLLDECRDKVLQLSDGAAKAARETLTTVLGILEENPAYEVAKDAVRRPDGVSVALDFDDPLATAGRCVQEDICIMQQQGGEHVLSGAVLCFPASWSLSEKFMRPLAGIHDVVHAYDAELARRVQRLFDAIRVGQPMWRANAHFYDAPVLFSPRRENQPRKPVSHPAPFIRSERQTMLRLPQTGAVLFTIHTYMVRHQDLSPQQARSIGAHQPNQQTGI